MGNIIQLKQIKQANNIIQAYRALEAQKVIALQRMAAAQQLMDFQTNGGKRKVLAFCFLTYDEVVRDDIWIKYFQNVSSEKYKIFVNGKKKEKILKSSLFANKQIPNPFRNTKWGEFSLVTAQHALFREALKNNNITHLILVSHNTIPIKRFDELYESLNYHSIIDFRIADEWEHKRRYHGIKNPQFPIETFFVQSQWCILTRIHATILVKDYNYIKIIFSEMRIPDEHCYINYLLHYKKALLIENHPSTFVDFSDGTPKVHKHINANTKSKCGKAFFIRKVSHDTTIE